MPPASLAQDLEGKRALVTAQPENTLEATQGQIDVFFSQLPYKCRQNRGASVGD